MTNGGEMVTDMKWLAFIPGARDWYWTHVVRDGTNFNLSESQPVIKSRPVNQLTCQEVNLSTDQTVKKSTRQQINSSASQPIYKSASKKDDLSSSQPVDKSLSRCFEFALRVSHNMTCLLLILELALIVCHKLAVFWVIQLTFIVCQKFPNLLHLLLALICKVNLHGMSHFMSIHPVGWEEFGKTHWPQMSVWANPVVKVTWTNETLSHVFVLVCVCVCECVC